MIIALCVLGYLLGMGIATGVAKAFDPYENEVPWVLIGIFWPLAIILYPTMLGTNYIANLVKKAIENQQKRRAEKKRQIRIDLEQAQREARIAQQEVEASLEQEDHLSEHQMNIRTR